MACPIDIRVQGRYARARHGCHWARYYDAQGVHYAPLDYQGRLAINTPGTWYMYTSDGRRREGMAVLIVHDTGAWRVLGQTRLFAVVDMTAREETDHVQ